MGTMTAGRRRGWALGWLAASGTAVAAAAAVGGLAARSGRPEFYEGLRRPSWAPPAEAFSPVWSVLYVTMAVAAWLVAREGTGDGRVRLALALFGGQLVLNAAWTPIFFGAERIDLALAEIAALLLLLIVTTAAFWRVSRSAGALTVPYLTWVAFATALNAAIAASN
jgi:tryptophan-rich sensory protein